MPDLEQSPEVGRRRVHALRSVRNLDPIDPFFGPVPRNDRMGGGMKAISRRLVALAGLAATCILSGLPLSAQTPDGLPQGRTGPGGANQAAGPSGQLPGQAGVIPLRKAAVFDIQLANLSEAPATPADKDRLPRVSDELRNELALQNVFEIVPISLAVKAEVEKRSGLRSCNGCAVDFARQLGAQVAVTTQISKVSSAVLNLVLYIKEVDGNQPEQSYGVNVRGDDRGSFDRAVKYVVDNVVVPKLAKPGRR